MTRLAAGLLPSLLLLAVVACRGPANGDGRASQALVIAKEQVAAPATPTAPALPPTAAPVPTAPPTMTAPPAAPAAPTSVEAVALADQAALTEHQGPAETDPSEPAADLSPCDRPPAAPLPPPGSPGWEALRSSFRTPLPPAPVYNPPGPRRVGLQVGHWQVEQVPDELRQLGGGSVGGGKAEWEVNLDLAQRTARLLEETGIVVDLLPATVPPRYRAHAFLAIHADGDESGQVRGFKLARAGFSATPEADDRLVASLYEAYGPATGLPRDDEHISRRMTAYYAFNSRRYCHAVAPGTPAAIIESGFLTNATDRRVLLADPDAAARGIADGLRRFLLPTS